MNSNKKVWESAFIVEPPGVLMNYYTVRRLIFFELTLKNVVVILYARTPAALFLITSYNKIKLSKLVKIANLDYCGAFDYN